jgi:flagellar biosynthesis GTPase FlhF
MTITSELKEQLKYNSDNNKLEFQNIEEIYFPHICIICRNYADKHIAKNIYGNYSSNKDYKKNYTFSLPVCESCRNNIELKTGISSKSGKMLLLLIILGSILAILLFLTLNSLWLSIGLLAIFIIFPVRNHKIKMKPKIKFENHLKIEVSNNDPDFVALEFADKEYAKTLEDINLSQIKLKQEQIEKEKQEQIEKEKQEQIEKEKQEQIEKEKQEQIEKEKQEQIEKEKQEQIEKENQEHVLDRNETETHPIDEKIESKPIPSEIAKTEHVGEENINKAQNKTCPKCKKVFELKWSFCDNCGSPLK